MPVANSVVLTAPVNTKSRQAAKSIKAITFVYFVTLASFLSAIGIMWDISWHASIGRDRFLTPPHSLIYLGAIFGGLFSGIQVLMNTFMSPVETRGSFVKVWGIFYSSLGALFCIWGAIAMLTSAPFDNWWHSAYGLDVQVVSPPHSLLALGIFSLQFGACICINKYINLATPGDKSLRTFQFLFVLATSSFLCMSYTFSSIVHSHNMRGALFYQKATMISLLLLPAFGRALRMKWGMTTIAISYFLMAGMTNWILQIFPAEPKLGPILTHTTHYQPANFPLLVMIPAFLMDLVMQKSKANDWGKAALLSAIFVLGLVAIQYPFSGFLLQSPGARNWFFGGNAWYFGNPPDAPYRYKFNPADIQPLPSFIKGIGIAMVLGVIISRISLKWGDWMLRIQR